MAEFSKQKIIILFSTLIFGAFIFLYSDIAKNLAGVDLSPALDPYIFVNDTGEKIDAAILVSSSPGSTFVL